MAPFDGLDELYHHTKFGEDRTMRAGCRSENVVFVYSVCHAPSPEHRALPFIGRFRRGFQRFFFTRLLFHTRYIVLTFVAR